MRHSSHTLAAALGATAAIALALPSSAQTLGCTTGGPGGAFPTSGTGGGGVYPGTLPPFELALPLAVTSLPAGATVVTEVVMHGLTHTWVADCQFVLTPPVGNPVNVFVRGNYTCDFGGDYTIHGECSGLGQALPAACSGTAIFPVGAYDQHFGVAGIAWPSGTAGIDNTSFYSVPAATGTWTLTIYDWAGADVGAITSWDICFGLPPALPAPSAAPTLTSPPNGGTASNPVSLVWSNVTCASGYDVDVDGTVYSTASPSYTASFAVGSHTWMARGKNSGGNGPWSGSQTFIVPNPPPPSVCITGGAGGAFPTSGSGDGTWPGTLPTYPLTAAHTLTVPAGATQIVAVKLNNIAHTWIGDLHVVLQEPVGGTKHTLFHRPVGGGPGLGTNCDLNGNYAIYETAGQAWPSVCPASGDIPPGDYNQDFGTWTSTVDSLNTPLSAIPVLAGSTGTWNLIIYDWAGGDIGSLTDFELCFDTVSSPTTFCPPQAPGTSNGCLPTISATAQPNTTHTSGCVITVSNVEGLKAGIVFYGLTAQSPIAWCGIAGGNSFLCIKAPTQRTGLQSSSGGTLNGCDGTLTLNWDTFQLTTIPSPLGNPWTAGDHAFVQGWFRDPPSCKTTFLSAALDMTYQ